MSDATQRNYHEERSKIRKDVSLSEELKKISVTSVDNEGDRQRWSYRDVQEPHHM